jgi:hypothetical protein
VTGPESNASGRVYSRAFETFVPDGNHAVGLLAYALYKARVWEAVLSAWRMDMGVDRVPTAVKVHAYRGEAKRRVQRLIAGAVAQATPDIERQGPVGALTQARSDIISEIRTRTSWQAAVLVNLVGWLLSIGITVLIVLSRIPDWVLRLATPRGAAP